MKKITFYFLFLISMLQIHAQSNVTFSVDMSGQTGFTTVYVSGSLNGWSGDANPLTDTDGDGVWETTLSIADGSYEYKFTYDNWTGQENLSQGLVGTSTNDCPSGICTNRTLKVNGADKILDVVPFGGSNISAGPYNVTFNIDMSGYTGSIGTVNINGENYNSQGLGAWCGACITLTDDNSDNIYTITVPLEAYTYSFKFTVNGWGAQEMFTPGNTGTQTIGGNTNRFLSVDKNMTVNAVWNQPASLSSPSNDKNFGVKMFPNPAKDYVTFSVNSNEDLDIQIFDITGKSVLSIENVQSQVNISDLNSGLYFVQMTLGTQQAT
ncbi:MAG: T9SS type A sorting domain-containing protein, partial [Bacteroidetes bacterium]|nr:T9SS type A sorting domain-containing protein [Bacteroidota bacterium]